MSNSCINIVVPNLPESVLDATVAAWNKQVGDEIQQDEILLEIETDKIMLEIPAPNTGRLESILKPAGSIVTSGEILGSLNIKTFLKKNNKNHKEPKEKNFLNIPSTETSNLDFNVLTPSVRKLIAEYDLNPENIQASGTKGRLTRQDIEHHIHNKEKENIINLKEDVKISAKHHTNDCISQKSFQGNQREVRVTMSRLRKRIAERLLHVKNSTAMLTTFNEVNMQPIIMLRKKYGEIFEKKYGIKLGLMSFYVTAVLKGLQNFPEINASIDGEEIVYYKYFDISIAVSTERGLVTPVLRNVDKLSVSDIEKNIKYLAEKGRNGKLTISDLTGGNFTITNGGIFGSLLSTPIINPPQSAILGMHIIKERPVAISGKMVILPMMYLALSYDHRLIDGKDSVNFLSFIKELLEDPIRLFLNV